MILTLHNNQNFNYLLQTMISKQIELEMRGWYHIDLNGIFYVEKTNTLV